MDYQQRKKQKLERRRKRQQKRKERTDKFVSKLVNKIKHEDAINKAKQIMKPTFDRSAWTPSDNTKQENGDTTVLMKQGFNRAVWQPPT